MLIRDWWSGIYDSVDSPERSVREPWRWQGENSVKNIEANFANFKARNAKLEQFEITAAKDIKDLKE